MVNKVILLGNLGADPEIRQAGSVQVAELRMATSETYKDKSGQKVTNTEWHTVELWDGLAKVAEQYLKKGSRIFVEGKIKTDVWEHEGQKRYKTKVRGTSMTMLGGKEESQAPAAQPHQTQPQNTAPEADFSDDIPF